MEGKGVKTFFSIVVWTLLLVLCWPVAILLLVLFPLAWLVLLPFRLAWIVVEAALALIRAILFLPARLLGARR